MHYCFNARGGGGDPVPLRTCIQANSATAKASPTPSTNHRWLIIRDGRDTDTFSPQQIPRRSCSRLRCSTATTKQHARIHTTVTLHFLYFFPAANAVPSRITSRYERSRAVYSPPNEHYSIMTPPEALSPLDSSELITPVAASPPLLALRVSTSALITTYRHVYLPLSETLVSKINVRDSKYHHRWAIAGKQHHVQEEEEHILEYKHPTLSPTANSPSSSKC